jgi:hypothetical protein
MKNQITTWVLFFFIMGIMAASVSAQDWAINADYTESCSCNPACPCLFGSPSTLGYCETVSFQSKVDRFGVESKRHFLLS